LGFGVGAHGAELVEGEVEAIAAYAGLKEEGGAGGVEADGEDGEELDGKGEGDPDEGDEDVEDALGELEAGLAVVAGAYLEIVSVEGVDRDLAGDDLEGAFEGAHVDAGEAAAEEIFGGEGGLGGAGWEDQLGDLVGFGEVGELGVGFRALEAFGG
jgi:hypothetical protein